MDLNNNVIAETSNDDDGNVVFSCFIVNKNDFEKSTTSDYVFGSGWIYYDVYYKLFKIVVDDNNNIPFDKDNSIIYFSISFTIQSGLEDFTPSVVYYKDDGDDSPERYGTTYKGEIFHATEEELQGQAYAVLDKDTGVLTFFRDEENKYTNKQEIGNKIYYTGFEEHQSNEWFNPWGGGWNHSEESKYIKEIIFIDAIKPNNVTGWFENLPILEKVNLEKLDTSLLTGLDYFFYNCPNLKYVDISTLDVKNINSLFKTFGGSGVVYLDFSVWNLNTDLPQLQMSEFLNTVSNLKYLNISNFGDWSSSAEFHSMDCLEKIVLGNKYDFSRSGNFGHAGYKWYNPEKNKMYTDTEIRDNLRNNSEDMSGYYIRPMCTTEVSFVSSYNPSKIKSSIVVEEVPETEDFEFEIEDLENVEYNKVVKFSVKPIDDYEVEEIIITDENDNVIEYVELDSDNEYEFTMPDTNVTIKPVYRKIQSINVPNTLKNIDTWDKILIIMLLITGLIIYTIVYKKESR